MNDTDSSEEPVEPPLTTTLDLHTFNPREVKSLVPEYLRACHEKGFRQVRIVHGKGKGHLRRTVHGLLDREAIVASYELAKDASSWGATDVVLR